MTRQIEQTGAGLKSVKLGTKDSHHQKTINFLVNKGVIPDDRPDTITKSADKIFDFILDHYTNLNSQKTRLQHVLYFLKLAGASKRVLEKFSNKGIELHNEVLVEKEKNVTTKDMYNLSTLKKKTEEMIQKATKDPTPDNINKALIMAMNTMRPPLRAGELSEMLVLDSPKVVPNVRRLDPESKDGWNYILIKPDEVEMVIRWSKTTDSHGVYRTKLPDALANLVRWAMGVDDQSYLITGGSPYEAIGYQKYNKLLASILGKGYSQNVLRSIYISDFLSKRHNTTEKRRLAKDMMSSVAMLDSYYKTINLPDDTDQSDVTSNLAPAPDTKQTEKPVATKTTPVFQSREEALKKKRAYNQTYNAEHREEISERSSRAYQNNKEGKDRAHALRRHAIYNNVRPQTLLKHNIYPADVDEYRSSHGIDAYMSEQ